MSAKQVLFHYGAPGSSWPDALEKVGGVNQRRTHIYVCRDGLAVSGARPRGQNMRTSADGAKRGRQFQRRAPPPNLSAGNDIAQIEDYQ
jgi:hypothetical protein